MFHIAQDSVRWTGQRALHFSSPGKPVHSDTNSAPLGSILAMQQLRAKTIHSHISTTYSQLLVYKTEWTIMERTKMHNLLNGSKGGFEPGLSRLRVWHSTAERPRSTTYNGDHHVLLTHMPRCWRVWLFQSRLRTAASFSVPPGKLVSVTRPHFYKATIFTLNRAITCVKHPHLYEATTPL